MPEQAPENGKIKVKLICPLFPVMEKEADSVLLPGLEGDILILPERAPLFLPLRPGRMIIYNKGEEPISYLLSRGVCEIRRNLCPVLAWGGREDKIDAHMIAEQLEVAGRGLENSKSGIAKREVISRIEFFKLVLKELHYEPQPLDGKEKNKRKRFDPSALGIDPKNKK